MKWLGWVCALLMLILFGFSVVENRNRSERIHDLEKQVKYYQNRISEYDYLAEKLQGIDEYIQWKDRIKVDMSHPSLERTREELWQERLRVIEEKDYYGDMK